MCGYNSICRELFSHYPYHIHCLRGTGLFLYNNRVVWHNDVIMMSLLTMQDLKGHDVKVVVRCCDPSYDIGPLTEAGIRVVVS